MTEPIMSGHQGTATVNARTLVVMVKLREPAEGETKPMTFTLLDHDIREAMGKGARMLDNAARKYTVSGFTWNLEDIGYHMNPSRTLVCTMRIARPD